MCCLEFVFFFQAEDGIRDIGVTGVQTCALPIYRFKTNNKIVDEMKVKAGTPVFICNGYGFADALSASPVAGAKQYPIILVGQNTMSKDTEEQIRNINPSTFYVIRSEEHTSEPVTPISRMPSSA